MARKRFSDEDVLNLLRQIDLELASGASIESACRKAGISDATYYSWRKRFGEMLIGLQQFTLIGECFA